MAKEKAEAQAEASTEAKQRGDGEYIVTCASLYMSVKGKLTELGAGTRIHLTAAQAKSKFLIDKVIPLEEHQTLVVGQAEAELDAAKQKVQSAKGS